MKNTKSKFKPFALVNFEEQTITYFDSLELVWQELNSQAISVGETAYIYDNFRVFEIKKEIQINAEEKIEITLDDKVLGAEANRISGK